ncbi:MAG: tRNA pseudouridine(55) synthase TruB [Cyanobacteriota bacterium]|nr:tRNA pseudouridine(55) synthase TruB [Cyanobacteriota bacterium]
MICGFLALDKPAGLSSHGCVAHVRRAYRLKRVGHGGTLDPAVTGVLPIALGAATRLLPYFPGEKAYRAVIQLGVRTSTDDLQGTVLSRQQPPVHLRVPDLEAALIPFRGAIAQRPPAFSAVHVNGRRAYALARQGLAVELAPRMVTVHRLDLLSWDPEHGQLAVDIHCSAGTYIRSLARDLGEALACGATLASLRRTSALGFGLDQCVGLEALNDPLPPLLDPLAVLSHLPRHSLTEADLAGWRCGRTQVASGDWPHGSAVLVVDPNGKLAGLAELRGSAELQPRLVLDACG